MLELRHLRYFVAVAEELNFSRAAERLHMAQPPLSVAIRQLEQELGTPLLLRTTRKVELTDAGRTFLDGARRTLTELERATIQARRAAAGELGRLRVAFSWSARFEREQVIELGALADDEFLFFPRELAPRLHDFMVGLCRRAGFEPKVRRESFHSGWEMQTLKDVPVVALAPASVARAVPDGLVAIPVGDPPDRLETEIVWRSDNTSATVSAFREDARNVFRTGTPRLEA